VLIGKLKISASTASGSDVDFDFRASLGELQVHAHFWDIAEVFKQFGEKLMDFPQSISDVVTLEIGIVHPGFYQNYLLLKAYCYDANGHSALKIITHNNKLEPQSQRIEFSILTEAAALNKLGSLLKNWQPQEVPDIVWQAQVS
jgi:hypothetical protein